jgi:hypothetical protein
VLFVVAKSYCRVSARRGRSNTNVKIARSFDVLTDSSYLGSDCFAKTNLRFKIRRRDE